MHTHEYVSVFSLIGHTTASEDALETFAPISHFPSFNCIHWFTIYNPYYSCHAFIVLLVVVQREHHCVLLCVVSKQLLCSSVLHFCAFLLRN